MQTKFYHVGPDKPGQIVWVFVCVCACMCACMCGSVCGYSIHIQDLHWQSKACGLVATHQPKRRRNLNIKPIGKSKNVCEGTLTLMGKLCRDHLSVTVGLWWRGAPTVRFLSLHSFGGDKVFCGFHPNNYGSQFITQWQTQCLGWLLCN